MDRNPGVMFPDIWISGIGVRVIVSFIAGMWRGVSFLSLLCLLAAVVPWSSREPMAAALRCEAFVWQSAAGPAVRQAVMRAAPHLDGLHFLAAEFSWDGTGMKVRRLPPPRVAGVDAAGSGRVVRLGQSTASLAWTPDQIAPVAKEIQSLAAEHPTEIHIDFDCPQRQLARYHGMLGKLQAAVPGTKLVFTALPSWLGRAGFPSPGRGVSGLCIASPCARAAVRS